MKLKVSVTENNDVYKKLKSDLEGNFNFVDVGIHGDEGSDLIEIAIKNEFGGTVVSGGVSYGFRTKKDLRENRVRFLKKGKGVVELGKTRITEKIIPSRPFLRQPFDKNIDVMTKFITKLHDKIITGEIKKKVALGLIGQKMVSLIVKAINTKGEYKKNSPMTIRMKKGKDQPLVNTGRLKNSIRHLLKKK